jgi:hypothetical protein
MNILHWRSLSAKVSVTATRDSHKCACFGHFGRHDTDRIISTSVAPPKVAKASTSVTLTRVVVAGVIALNFANVNTALGVIF